MSSVQIIPSGIHSIPSDKHTIISCTHTNTSGVHTSASAAHTTTIVTLPVVCSPHYVASGGAHHILPGVAHSVATGTLTATSDAWPSGAHLTTITGIQPGGLQPIVPDHAPDSSHPCSSPPLHHPNSLPVSTMAVTSSTSPLAPGRFVCTGTKRPPAHSPSSSSPPMRWGGAGASPTGAGGSPIKKTRTLAEIKAQMKARKQAAASNIRSTTATSLLPPPIVLHSNAHMFSTTTFPVYFPVVPHHHNIIPAVTSSHHHPATAWPPTLPSRAPTYMRLPVLTSCPPIGQLPTLWPVRHLAGMAGGSGDVMTQFHPVLTPRLVQQPIHAPLPSAGKASVAHHQNQMVIARPQHQQSRDAAPPSPSARNCSQPTSEPPTVQPVSVKREKVDTPDSCGFPAPSTAKKKKLLPPATDRPAPACHPAAKHENPQRATITLKIKAAGSAISLKVDPDVIDAERKRLPEVTSDNDEDVEISDSDDNDDDSNSSDSERAESGGDERESPRKRKLTTGNDVVVKTKRPRWSQVANGPIRLRSSAANSVIGARSKVLPGPTPPVFGATPFKMKPTSSLLPTSSHAKPLLQSSKLKIVQAISCCNSWSSTNATPKVAFNNNVGTGVTSSGVASVAISTAGGGGKYRSTSRGKSLQNMQALQRNSRIHSDDSRDDDDADSSDDDSTQSSSDTDKCSESSSSDRDWPKYYISSKVPEDDPGGSNRSSQHRKHLKNSSVKP